MFGGGGVGRVFGGQNKPKWTEETPWKRLTFSEKLIHFGMMRNDGAEISPSPPHLPPFPQHSSGDAAERMLRSGGGAGTLGQTGGWMRGR